MTEWTPEEEAVARALAGVNGHPDDMTYHTIEPGVMEPWGPRWMHFLADARAAIAAMQPRWRDVKTDPPPRGDWQPIETAPRDGRRFLTWCKTYGVRVGRAYNRADHDDWLSNLDAYGGSSKGGIRATHWMPLPPAPEPKP